MRALLTGVATSTLLFLNTLAGILPMLVLSLIKLLIPWRPVQSGCFEAVRWIASTWASINAHIFRLLTPTRWDVRGQQALSRKESLLVISNHQSWVDIPALMAAIHGKAPFFTFFLKRELIWVPFLGLAWWALEYPFMRRYSRQQLEKNPALRGKDLEITRKACDRLQGRPVSLVNYLEGTRFTLAKHQAQQSPYRYLLKPKSGGVAFTLSAMGDQLHQLLDVTVVYAGERPPTFVELLTGKVGHVIIDVEKHPIPEIMKQGDYQEDEAFREMFQQWINQLWQQKDEKIDRLRKELKGQA
ncbi:acyltransferase [Marinospirillum alkaliphilum]|uniref:1-acyl-sn-glycerol-3-phosphate acyltransferase n=1 Tax=Marinospirillum alkaliphilum DSM 21637 TaxID=1122209 RepID=A0A1K1Y2F0_9GAMM|nr:acyltransferase [Marinospirillum alkaliphilum]SFX56154.1 1-acyl-sn-glycerol-3-phosphate acyltransferase [Marinospirillum alkaliphilum DSM 21637]